MWVRVGKTFLIIYVSIHCNFLYNEVIEIIFIIRKELTVYKAKRKEKSSAILIHAAHLKMFNHSR